jgi:hypothetical protein
VRPGNERAPRILLSCNHAVFMSSKIQVISVPSLFCVGDRLLRSHFKHSVELVDDNGEIVDQLAGVQDFMLAKATYDAAVRRWPKARIRLCQEARIVEDTG